ncbi:hypothetical protein [Streptomyces herbicida]|uniref:hypothetical protein n=1 Tax=Streptomyces herbicida TaxID=3065675 RepID=UPI00292DD98F|nr:hypothetical protein [Streptomyces sp. NEAU-HV9]
MDLTQVPSTPVPVDGYIHRAHRRISLLLASQGSDRLPARSQLRQIYSLAWRALRGLHRIPDLAPQVVRAVSSECDKDWPHASEVRSSQDAGSMAVGSALACVALDTSHPDYEVVFDWILTADRPPSAGHQPIRMGVLAAGWRWGGDELVSRALAHLDKDGRLPTRLRYGSATPQPRWPDLPETVITRRAEMLPAMLWPGWTMRLLPTAKQRPIPGPNNPHTAVFRRLCASFLLLPGSPSHLNFGRFARLLGGQRRIDQEAFERLYEGLDVTPLASVLAQLAYMLDESGSPINYARRRALFTYTTVSLDLSAYTRLCIQHGWSTGKSQRIAIMQWYLLMLLTGEHHGNSSHATHRFAWQCNDFRFRAPRALRRFLHEQAEIHLTRHGIQEPVTWEPHNDWVTGASWPGITLTDIDHQRFCQLLEAGGTVHDVAAAHSLTAEHVRLYCELSDTGIPLAAANGTRTSEERHEILAPEQLRNLYETQRLEITRIAELASCGKSTVQQLLEHDGVVLRGRPILLPPRPDLTREWLQREYVENLRDLKALAKEGDVTPYHLLKLAEAWKIPLRGPGSYNPLGHLPLVQQASPAMRAVTNTAQAVTRLLLITKIPGYTSLRAAADALYDGNLRALRQRLRHIEKATGFSIIDCSTSPITPTKRGRSLILEAIPILQAAEAAKMPQLGKGRHLSET